MGFKLACKAFLLAFREPDKAQKFVNEEPPKQIETTDQSHICLLQYLQQASRLIDFLKEDIKAFSDAQIGAAVRKIHQDSAQVLEELVTIRALKEEQEGSTVQILKGYNPSEIKVVGKIKGEPPFSGILVHRGWKAQKRSLPKQSGGESAFQVICPAEVEIKS